MASVGCSLMEAYNIPSFDTPKRRKGCVIDANEIKASSEPYEPYTDTSREMAMWKRGETKRRIQEGFQSQPLEGTMPKQYSGYVQDKNYYCKNFQICPETFRGSQGSQDYESVPDQQPKQAGDAKKQRGANGKTCSGPLQPPRYDYPMTDDARAQYDKALSLSLQQETGSTPHYPSVPLEGTDKDVHGYTDEDLDQFLRTNEMKSEAQISIPKLLREPPAVSGRDPYASHFAESMKDFTKNGVPQLKPGSDSTKDSNEKPVDPWDRVWDMALFVVAGLLIILLLEQLFKLAMLYGMKRAFLAIEPLLVAHQAQGLRAD